MKAAGRNDEAAAGRYNEEAGRYNEVVAAHYK